MRKTNCERVDSDEDKVTFDDELQTVNSELNWNTDNAKHSFDSVKYRPLFQYRRFKGELDDSEDDSEDSDRKLLKVNYVGEQRNDFDLHTTASAEDNGSAQRIEKNLQDKFSMDQRPLDVALDRPGHWKSSSGMLRSKIVNEKKNETAISAVATKKKKTLHHTRSDTVYKHSTHLVTGCTTLSSKSRDNIVQNIHSLSFQPSWMTSVQSSEGRNVSHNVETDDILDESGQVHQWSDSHGDPFVPSQQQRPLQQWSEPAFSQLQSPGPTPGLNIGSGGHSGGRRHTGKARPGSLKARVQKLQHDCDAAENRVVNFKPGTELSDPRNRAFAYCDVEVVSVLPFTLTTAPFNVATVIVRQYWTKPAPLSNVSTPARGGIQEQKGESASPSLSGQDLDLHGLANDLAEEVTVEQVILSQQTPRKNQTNSALVLSHVTSPDKYTEKFATAYFKPSACAGAHRAIRAGVLCRVYNPQFVSEPEPIDDSSVFLHVLCSCWEPLV